MRRFTTFLAALAFAAPLGAQMQASDASVTVTITAVLSLTNTSGIAFGAVATSAGTVFTGSTNHAAWSGSSDIGNSLDITFTIPAGLTRVGGGGTPVPFSCGNLSARFDDGASVSEFDPSLGLAGRNNSSGPFSVSLGAGGDPSRQCSINVTGRTPGDYSGLVTLTVAVV